MNQLGELGLAALQILRCMVAFMGSGLSLCRHLKVPVTGFKSSVRDLMWYKWLYNAVQAGTLALRR